MTPNTAPYQADTEITMLSPIVPAFTLSQNGTSKVEKVVPEVLFITSFPPRECGIATYSQDLVNALNDQFENTFTASICALESATEQHIYSQRPKYILNTDVRNSFKKTAFYINRDDNIKLVVMQHEFGFFAEKEEAFRFLFNSISKPIVFVFHTILPASSEELRSKVQDMASIASALIVMTQHAATLLVKDYGIAAHKITVIPHGTHLTPPANRNLLKQKHQLATRKVLSTFGLLGPSKSIETSLEALLSVIKKQPNVLFLVLGKTHPTLVKHEGEQYRTMLETKVAELGIGDHVRFVNEYLELPTLLEYLQLSDIYLFTSKDPHQAVSGTLSYAVSCGCPVISTPIPHAKEVLNSNNGVLIDFENAEQLSIAILSLLGNDRLREELSYNSLHKMAATSWQNSAIAHTLLFELLTVDAFRINYRVPPIDLAHVKNMTTDVGMIQFAKIASPDLNSGYTLDDNARALIAVCMHYELYGDEGDLLLIETYLNFMMYCQQSNGLFFNYVNKHKEYTQENFSENLEDSHGRAIWALGYVISLQNVLPIGLVETARSVLEEVLPHVSNIYSTRAMAFIIKGLHYQNEVDNMHLIRAFGERMVQMYKHEKTEGWHWFENYLTYGNSLLPEALMCAYLSTHDHTYLAIAKESFDFLLSKIFVDNKISVISNKGWHIKDNADENVVGGEQPIDVAYTILALAKFYFVLRKDEYRKKLTVAFNWFLGNNHLHQIVYNPATGGCFDGVEEHNVNLNQGAESTLSYLLARLTVEEVKIFDEILASQRSTLPAMRELESQLLLVVEA